MFIGAFDHNARRCGENTTIALGASAAALGVILFFTSHGGLSAFDLGLIGVGGLGALLGITGRAIQLLPTKTSPEFPVEVICKHFSIPQVRSEPDLRTFWLKHQL